MKFICEKENLLLGLNAVSRTSVGFEDNFQTKNYENLYPNIVFFILSTIIFVFGFDIIADSILLIA